MREVTKTIKVEDEEFAPEGAEREVVLVAFEFENHDEALQEIGSPDDIVKILNRYKTRNAFQAAVNKYNYRMVKDRPANLDAFNEFLSELPETSKGYKFEVGEGSSAREVLKSVNAIKDQVGKMSAEELQNLSALDVLAKLGIDISKLATAA